MSEIIKNEIIKSKKSLIEIIQQRVLKVSCPFCNAAIGAFCTESYHNAAGKQTRFIPNDLFHAERIVKAQNLYEKALDMTRRIQIYLDQYPLK